MKQAVSIDRQTWYTEIEKDQTSQVIPSAHKNSLKGKNMEHDYVLLAEKEEMWVRMLLQVLEDNNIPCTALPVHGAGVVINTGIQERLKVYVPCTNKSAAEDLMNELFR